MNIKLTSKSVPSDVLILPVFTGEEKQFFNQFIKQGLPEGIEKDFKNHLGRFQLLYTSDANHPRVMLLGLGKKERLTVGNLRLAIQAAMLNLAKLEIQSLTLVVPDLPRSQIESCFEALGFAMIFGTYQFTTYKKTQKWQLQNIYIFGKKLTSSQLKFINRGMAIAYAANDARDLANHPGNVATPTHLALHAKKLAKEYGFDAEVYGPKEIAKEKLGLLQGVARGSSEPAQFIILKYGKPSKNPVVLIGKGLTFDSGGVSIKPSERLEEMKYDMAGGATVLGIFAAAAQLKVPVSLVGLIPASENLISGAALKPGDILTSHNGKTVEIINTDAEGRLILADAISFAKKYYEPKLIIDYATLTGAVIQSLGDEYTGVFTNTPKTLKAMEEASAKSGEKFWHLPIAREYVDQVASLVADLKNVGDKGFAGAPAAALFLDNFVGKTPWIHMDIAGTAWSMKNKPHLPAGASAWGVFFTLNFLRNFPKF